MKSKLDEYRCYECNRIRWKWVFAEIKYSIKGLKKKFKKCQKCGKRGVYAQDEEKWLCFDCYVDTTGLPF